MERSPRQNRRSPDGKRSVARQDPVSKGAAASGGTPVKQSSGLASAVGAVFRSARETQKLSQEQVAALTAARAPEISRTAISSIERGTNLPGLEVLVSLSEVLYVDPAEILDLVKIRTAQPVELTGVTREDLATQAEKYFWAGDYRRALATYDAILHHLALDPPRDAYERTRLTTRHEINRAATLRRCCALTAARAAAERAVSLARGVPDLQSEAYVALASVLSDGGRLLFARDAVEHAVRLSSSCGPRTRGMAWNEKGGVCYQSGEYEAAQTAYIEARRLFLEAGDQRHLVHIEGNLGSCLLAEGKTEHARERFAAAVDLARKSGEPALEASFLIELGGVAFLKGEFEKADGYAEAALRIAKPADHVLTIFRAEWLRHKVASGRSPEAPDRHRLAYLRRLHGRLGEHRGVDVVREFEVALIGASLTKTWRSS